MQCWILALKGVQVLKLVSRRDIGYLDPLARQSLDYRLHLLSAYDVRLKSYGTDIGALCDLIYEMFVLRQADLQSHQLFVSQYRRQYRC